MTESGPESLDIAQGKVLLLPHDRDRSEIAAALIALLRRAGMRVAATGDIGVGMRRTGPGLRRRVPGGVRS
jgi:imidazolonepropionase-like amidohydrolase